MTLEEMDDLLRALVEEPESDDSANLPLSESLVYLKEGHRAVARKTRSLRKTDTLSFAAGAASATLPTDWLDTIRVYTTQPLRQTSHERLDIEFEGMDWQSYEGTPERYFHFARSLYLFPKTKATITPTIWYAYLPDMSTWTTENMDSTDSPLFEEFQFPVVLYAKWLVAIKRAGGSETSETVAAKQMYEAVVTERLANFNENQHDYAHVAVPVWGDF